MLQNAAAGRFVLLNSSDLSVTTANVTASGVTCRGDIKMEIR